MSKLILYRVLGHQEGGIVYELGVHVRNVVSFNNNLLTWILL